MPPGPGGPGPARGGMALGQSLGEPCLPRPSHARNLTQFISAPESSWQAATRLGEVTTSSSYGSASGAGNRGPWQVDPARHCNPAGGRGRRPILRRCRGRGRRQLGGRGPGSASESIMMAGWPRRTRTHSELESPLASRWTRRLAAALRPGGPTGGPAKPSSTSSVKPGSGSICR